MEETKCKKCKGKGKHRDSSQCGTCKGSGSVVVILNVDGSKIIKPAVRS